MRIYKEAREDEDDNDELQRAFRMSLLPNEEDPGRDGRAGENVSIDGEASHSGELEPPNQQLGASSLHAKRGREEEMGETLGGDGGNGFNGGLSRGVIVGGVKGGVGGRGESDCDRESETEKERRIQREMRAAAADRRRLEMQGGGGQIAGGQGIAWPNVESSGAFSRSGDARMAAHVSLSLGEDKPPGPDIVGRADDNKNSEKEKIDGSKIGVAKAFRASDLTIGGLENTDMTGDALPDSEARKLFGIVFGDNPPKDSLVQWSHQGFRFSEDKETSHGLVQKEGGPCGVLAPIQALVIKYLLFEKGDIQEHVQKRFSGSPPKAIVARGEMRPSDCVFEGRSFTDEERTRALVGAMAEVLWQAGNGMKAAVVVYSSLSPQDANMTSPNKTSTSTEDDGFKFRGLLMGGPEKLQASTSVIWSTNVASLIQTISSALPVFQSPLGAAMFLFSALLSRGLDEIQGDRDDPEPPLVTRPFGHASQEIVNLLLCGRAVANVFDGSMDLGGGMKLKGVSSAVEVGFLTLLEALHLCKVGQNLKVPRLPIWVVGSESHYTVLFGTSFAVQEEDDVEEQEARIRKVFDEFDASGGGGFVACDSLDTILTRLEIKMPQEMQDELKTLGVIVWNEFWHSLRRLERARGGLMEAVSGSAPKARQFELHHFNGIAKSTGGVSEGPCGQAQRPRQKRIRVNVPPRWTHDLMMVENGGNVSGAAQGVQDEGDSTAGQVEASQHAPLVDCIRTRWQRATCNWSGEAPSIV